MNIKAPPCWFTALLLAICLPLSLIAYGFDVFVMNVIALLGWVLAELYERESKAEKARK